jgi:hypothetical protein
MMYNGEVNIAGTVPLHIRQYQGGAYEGDHPFVPRGNKRGTVTGNPLTNNELLIQNFKVVTGNHSFPYGGYKKKSKAKPKKK